MICTLLHPHPNPVQESLSIVFGKDALVGQFQSAFANSTACLDGIAKIFGSLGTPVGEFEAVLADFIA